MTDATAVERLIKGFLHYATREKDGAILFGTQFDPTEQKWVGAMSIGETKITFPPGIGRRVTRELREKASGTARDLTEQMRADMGAHAFAEIFDKIDEACVTAMQRNAAGSKPEFFAHSGLAETLQ